MRKRYPRVQRNCLNCGKEIFILQSRIKIGKGKFCSIRCGKVGKRSIFWKGGKRTVNGYVRIYKPDHPNSDQQGCMAEHRLVMEKYLGRYLTKKEVVHHKNSNKQDNRIENLELLPNQSIHYIKHMTGNKIWLGKKHKPETIEKMKKLWTKARKMKQRKMFKGKGNPNYKEGKYA